LLVSLKAQDLFDLRGRIALLTGASGFLGRTLGVALLENGARLIALGRSSRLEAVVAGWRRTYGEDRAQAVQVDMYDNVALETALARLVHEHGCIDILVNNAHELGPATGFNSPEGTLETAPMDQWLRHFSGAVCWPALATRVVGETMKQRGRGTIINISTMYARVAPSPQLYEGTPFGNPPGYSASKAALEALTRYTASFWGRYGIRANAIAPGPFSNTEDTTPNSVVEGDPFLERLKDRTCLGRVGRPDELAGALLYLASDASSYMTGQVLVVDGGWTVT
jgi:NAD(P)-dependent dehydrogenase (short-subunit alcohol dehydrogenase family)